MHLVLHGSIRIEAGIYDTKRMKSSFPSYAILYGSFLYLFGAAILPASVLELTAAADTYTVRGDEAGTVRGSETTVRTKNSAS